MTASLELELPADLAELTVLARALEGFADAHGVDPEVMLQMNVALEELVTNVINYAARADRACRIELRLSLAPDALTAELSDDAGPFDPTAMPPPDLGVTLAERKVGGLGIHMVRSLMDEVRYRRANGRNQLVLVKRHATRAAAPDGSA